MTTAAGDLKIPKISSPAQDRSASNTDSDSPATPYTPSIPDEDHLTGYTTSPHQIRANVLAATPAANAAHVNTLWPSGEASDDRTLGHDQTGTKSSIVDGHNTPLLSGDAGPAVCTSAMMSAGTSGTPDNSTGHPGEAVQQTSDASEMICKHSSGDDLGASTGHVNCKVRINHCPTRPVSVICHAISPELAGSNNTTDHITQHSATSTTTTTTRTTSTSTTITRATSTTTTDVRFTTSLTGADGDSNISTATYSHHATAATTTTTTSAIGGAAGLGTCTDATDTPPGTATINTTTTAPTATKPPSFLQLILGGALLAVAGLVVIILAIVGLVKVLVLVVLSPMGLGPWVVLTTYLAAEAAFYVW